VSSQKPRWLEENNADNEDLSQFTLQQGTCFRMKIGNDNDDDGNSYFYNGSYRSQYKRYVSFSLCNTKTGECSEYVTDLEDFLEESVDYVQNMCGSCANQCRRRNRVMRRLEEEDPEEDEESNDGEGMTVNCNTCVDECQLLNNKGDDGSDESGYLECQADYEDGDIEYYTAPQCENGEVVIGHFYDDECTIKTSTLQDSGFSYNTFRTIASIQIDCSLSDNCADLFDDAISCSGGNEDNDEDDAKLCKAAKAATRVQTFYKKPFYKKTPWIPIFLLISVAGFGVGFLAWTYFVRHTRHADVKVPMASLDGGEDLPPVS
jgi:hypothetical protein